MNNIKNYLIQKQVYFGWNSKYNINRKELDLFEKLERDLKEVRVIVVDYNRVGSEFRLFRKDETSIKIIINALRLVKWKRKNT